MTDGRAPSCGARTAAGTPCRSTLLRSSGLCNHHDPEYAAEMKLARAAGGRATADIVRLANRIKETTTPANLPSFPPDSLERIAHWHMWVSNAVATGEIDFKVAREVTTSLRELRPVLMNMDLERRLKEAERMLAKARKELERRGAYDE